MKVNLTYFKHTGKFYADGSYDSQWTDLLDIWDEVRDMAFHRKDLPDFSCPDTFPLKR